MSSLLTGVNFLCVVGCVQHWEAAEFSDPVGCPLLCVRTKFYSNSCGFTGCVGKIDICKKYLPILAFSLSHTLCKSQGGHLRLLGSHSVWLWSRIHSETGPEANVGDYVRS